MIAAILVGVPSMTLANAAEYKVAGIIVGSDIDRGSALRIAVLSTAANLLPIPGGPLVKAKGLIDEGARAGRAILATVLMAGAWLATSLLIAGLFGGIDLWASAAIVVVASVLGIGVFAVLIRRVLQDRKAVVAGLVAAVELAATLATGLRMWLIAQALGFDLGSGALVLGIAPVLGSAVVFVPAGLGVRELVASLAAPAVGLTVASGFLISSVDRLAGMLVHGVAAVVFVISDGRDRAHGKGS
jgi:hypothetical protein